jgi:CDP-glycerol glycerophosphotransferase (TagB/SpsB family)
MFAPMRWSEGPRAILDILFGIVGWLTLAPLAALMPKRRDWIAVIGREDGKFLDNAKHFFIQASLERQHGLRIAFITEREDVHEVIIGSGLEAFRYPSLRAAWFLVRCGSVVVDSIEWSARGRRFLLSRARLVQLWHGVGFKRIELDKWRNEAAGRGWMSSPWLLRARLLRKRLNGRIPRYDVVITTSRFYRDNVFRKAFRARHVVPAGYPRNSFTRPDHGSHTLTWSNVDHAARKQIKAWHSEGRRVILVAPTFRDTRATPLGLDEAWQQRLDAFCETHRCEMLFKFHPYERGAATISGRHLHVLEPHSDAYPLFPFVDTLVTDYSSIYMDYLLLDRPVLFFTPDAELYISRDRSIQFDFDKMTPGPKLESWQELLDALKDQASSDWAARRTEVRQMAFDDDDPSRATERILAFMGAQGWVPCIGANDNQSEQ